MQGVPRTGMIQGFHTYSKVPTCMSIEISKLTRDGTAVPVSRYIILGANAPDRAKYCFPYSADHVQDCSPYPAQLINIYSFYMCDLYIIYMYAYILFATCLYAGILRKLLYIYNRGISGVHFLGR